MSQQKHRTEVRGEPRTPRRHAGQVVKCCRVRPLPRLLLSITDLVGVAAEPMVASYNDQTAGTCMPCSDRARRSGSSGLDGGVGWYKTVAPDGSPLNNAASGGRSGLPIHQRCRGVD